MMDKVTHVLLLTAMILVIMVALMWLSGMSCLWGYVDGVSDEIGPWSEKMMGKASTGFTERNSSMKAASCCDDSTDAVYNGKTSDGDPKTDVDAANDPSLATSSFGGFMFKSYGCANLSDADGKKLCKPSTT